VRIDPNIPGQGQYRRPGGQAGGHSGGQGVSEGILILEDLEMSEVTGGSERKVSGCGGTTVRS